MIRHLPKSRFLAMPWKNGNGVTTQIAVFPEDASLENFDWRISLADVKTDGPFSLFPGVERTLCVIEGNGIDLDFGDQDLAGLKQIESLNILSEPCSFAADVPVSGHLPAGSIRDLNVMTRRSRARHQVARLMVEAEQSVVGLGDVLVLFAPDERLELICADGRVQLEPGDAAIVKQISGSSVSVHGKAACLFAVHIWLSAEPV